MSHASETGQSQGAPPSSAHKPRPCSAGGQSQIVPRVVPPELPPTPPDAPLPPLPLVLPALEPLLPPEVLALPELPLAPEVLEPGPLGVGQAARSQRTTASCSAVAKGRAFGVNVLAPGECFRTAT